MGSLLDSIFGRKPEVAPFVKTDLQKEQANSVAGNRAILDQVGALADETAVRSGQTTRKGIESVTPGGTANIDKSTEQIGSFLKGEIPDDVADEIVRRTAELSTQRGVTPRSGIGNNFTARELGLTSLNLVQEGISLAESWMKTAQGGFDSLNFGSMFIDPKTQATFTAQQLEAERSIKQAEFNVDAAPNPAAAGLAKIATTVVGGIVGGPIGAGLANSLFKSQGAEADGNFMKTKDKDLGSTSEGAYKTLTS